MTTENIDELIEEFFAENLKAIQLEGGHALAPEVKLTALWQVRLYWRKLREVAEKVTDTEVKLSLPQQKMLSKDKMFGIEGVVDIVRENDKVVMYDIKTHEADEIRKRPDTYRKQLNVYAYIWEKLHGEQLDATAVICTAYPQAMRDAIQTGDEVRLAAEVAQWEPIIDLDFNSERALATIREFAEVVELIENHEFAPRPLEDLNRPDYPGAKAIFAVNTCRNCDARFSCASYRQYALGSGSGRAVEKKFQHYYGDLGTDQEREDWVASSLDIEPTLTEADEFLE